MDETFKQLIGETREPLPPRPGSASDGGAVERHDHVYTRNRVASLLLRNRNGLRWACELLAGWRHVAATGQRRRGDWAVFIRGLLDGRHRDAERVVLVMDQLNTHSPASLYQAFAPAEAKRLADRLEVHHTPKHGSWLNGDGFAVLASSGSLRDGRDRACSPRTPMPCPAHRPARHPVPPGRSLGGTAQQCAGQNYLAVHNQPSPDQTQKPLLIN